MANTLSLKFGDVFKYGEADYVYLALVNDVLYAARIHDLDKTRLLLNRHQQVDSNPGLRRKYGDNILYCFVILTTNQFKDQMAHFKGSEHDASLQPTPTGISLNQTDLKEILDTIVDSPALPRALKKAVKDIKIV